MAPMATPLPAASGQVAPVRRQSPRTAWLLWILVSVLCAAIGAALAWQIRSPFIRSSASTQQQLALVATLASALVLSGGQWLLLRRYRLDVYWWVPASAAGNLVAAAFIVPAVASLAFTKGVSPINANTAVLYGALALAASGLVVGTAQALVLRTSFGDLAWAWVPATMLGGALAGGIATVLSNDVLSSVWLLEHPILLLTLASAVSGGLLSICQAPVIARMLR